MRSVCVRMRVILVGKDGSEAALQVMGKESREKLRKERGVLTKESHQPCLISGASRLPRYWFLA
jgi:hypothetical protein